MRLLFFPHKLYALKNAFFFRFRRAFSTRGPPVPKQTSRAHLTVCSCVWLLTVGFPFCTKSLTGTVWRVPRIAFSHKRLYLTFLSLVLVVWLSADKLCKSFKILFFFFFFAKLFLIWDHCFVFCTNP